MNIWIGLFSRALALYALVGCNREKRGLMSYTSTFAVYVINPLQDYFQRRFSDEDGQGAVMSRAGMVGVCS